MSVDFGIGGGQGTSPLRYQGMTVLLDVIIKVNVLTSQVRKCSNAIIPLAFMVSGQCSVLTLCATSISLVMCLRLL
jgi:hypothetical protein